MQLLFLSSLQNLGQDEKCEFELAEFENVDGRDAPVFGLVVG
jgi:hypothetical protein